MKGYTKERNELESREVQNRWNVRAYESEEWNLISLRKRGQVSMWGGLDHSATAVTYEEEQDILSPRHSEQAQRSRSQYGAVSPHISRRPWDPERAWLPPGSLSPSPKSKKKSVGPPIFHLPEEARFLIAEESHQRSIIAKKRTVFLSHMVHETACMFYARSGRWYHNSVNRSFSKLSMSVMTTLGEEGVKGLQALRLRFIETYPDPMPRSLPPSLLSGHSAHETASDHTIPIEVPKVKAISLGDAKAVLSSLRASDGVCADKGGADALTQSNSANMQTLSTWLTEAYKQKRGDVLTELATNLIAPSSLNTTEQKVQILSLAAHHLHESKGRYYPSRSPVDLLVMSLYTMTGPDIDTVFTFSDVPDYDTQPEEWKEYGTRYTDRNKAIFSEINWAMRTAAYPPDMASGAWQTLQKWCKYICLVTALSSIVGASPSTELARGLAGLPDFVVEQHAKLSKGDLVNWPSPSSCALDRRVSESYIRGDAANAIQAAGGAILFILRRMQWGIPLQNISKYPKESEVLVPPLSVLVVEDVTVLPSRHYALSLPDGTLVVKAACESIMALNKGFGKHCRMWLRDGCAASRRAQQVLGDLPQLCSITKRSSTLRLHTGASYGKAIKVYGGTVIQPDTPSSPHRDQRAISSDCRLLKHTMSSQPMEHAPTAQQQSQPLPASSRMLQMTMSWEQKLLARSIEGVKTPLDDFDDL
eukprot:TRINITY_DN19849_c0_g1_i1.p1 TRINITY_DN19849_c0_g1~~TRINITY_DN19849_c0_g1_i1.p1  ORF type:complete len:704 (+),score=103.74 TRINITY_DN19849_c0_g1_i1:34-2145(+)